MDDKERRIALTKKVNLAGIADGWDECYAIVTLAPFGELNELLTKDFTGMKYLDVIKYEMGVVDKHFVSGKILTINAKGETTLEPMVTKDISQYSTIADMLYGAVIGVDLNPKDTRTEAPSKSES